MLLSDEELARLESIAPFLQSEAVTALQGPIRYDVTMELASHLQPGLRFRVPETPPKGGDPEAPPYPLDLFVGLPLDELRALSNADENSRRALIARFGASFSPRLLKAIGGLTSHEVDLDAGVQSEAGTVAVMLDDKV